MKFQQNITKKTIKIKWSVKLILIVFLFPIKVVSQDISGVWTGHIYNDTTQKNIHYELAINETDGKASGYSHTTFVSDTAKSVGVKTVKIKIKNNRIEVVDDKFIYNNFPTPPPSGVKMYSFLTLSENDSTDVLSGNWMTNSTKIYNSVTGTIFLEKKKVKPEETVIVTKLIQLGLGDQLAFLPPSIASRNLIAINAKPNPQKIIPDNVTTNVSKSEEAVKKPQEASSNEKQNENISKAEDENKNQRTITENPKTKAPAGIAKIEEPQIAAQKKNELALNETHKEQSKIQQDSPKQEPQQTFESKKAESDKTAEVKKNEKSLNENEKKPAKEINVSSEKQSPSIVQQNKENIYKAGEINKNQIASNGFPKNNEANATVEPIKKEQQSSSEEKKEDSSKAENQNKNEVVNNENKSARATPPPAAEISKREIQTIRTVDIVSKDSLQFSLYDNGTVDGDTVTVLINGKVVMPRVGLLERAINKTIYLTPEMGDSISVVMYAENLGSIPPNTGLLVIRDENKIYEIRFSGDLQKNSAIILVRKKKT
ncbi:MAG TPA: hypothetical protein VN722_09450 [Hanamia sp.]|nr:hypothetical protein [Hanamia sp.]